MVGIIAPMIWYFTSVRSCSTRVKNWSWLIWLFEFPPHLHHTPRHTCITHHTTLALWRNKTKKKSYGQQVVSYFWNRIHNKQKSSFYKQNASKEVRSLKGKRLEHSMKHFETSMKATQTMIIWNQGSQMIFTLLINQ